MFDLKQVETADFGGVPIPVAGRVVLFVGADGLLRGRMPGGQVVQVLQGAAGPAGPAGPAGAAGAQGAPGSAAAVCQQGIDVAQAASAAGLTLHSAASPVALVGSMVRVMLLFQVNSAAAASWSPQLNIGGLLVDFNTTSTTGVRVVVVKVDVYVKSATAARCLMELGTGAVGGQVPAAFYQAAAVSGSVTGQAVSVAIRGAVTVTILSAVVEVI